LLPYIFPRNKTKLSISTVYRYNFKWVLGLSRSQQHQPVLAEAVQRFWLSNPDGHYLDATFGRGGHSQALLSVLASQARLLALDRDAEAVAVAQDLAQRDARVVAVQGNFADLATILAAQGFQTPLSGILLDLGVSSPQLDTPERGFSFQTDGPLDMRMDNKSGMSVADWLATASAQSIAEVLWRYGEERFAKRIAAAIVREREKSPLQTTQQLVAVVKAASPFSEKHKHPATRTFQALRIFINQELTALERALPQAVAALAPGGRLLVISFHSLEDRLVKQYFKALSKPFLAPDLRHLPLTEAGIPAAGFQMLSKPIQATAAEIAANARARSAVLRVIEKRPAKNFLNLICYA
jgi:16S rRNA (cytosine1402-N4)-methyltransferase